MSAAADDRRAAADVPRNVPAKPKEWTPARVEERLRKAVAAQVS